MVAPLAFLPAWCPLCGARLRAREDESRAVCFQCGALLDVMPQPTATVARHLGEDMRAVARTLQPDAVERSLVRLRETLAAREVALRDVIQAARTRRIWLVGVGLAMSGGLALMLLGQSLPGLIVLLGSFNAMRGLATGRTGRENGISERDAIESLVAQRREIARRELVLAAMRDGREWR